MVRTKTLKIWAGNFFAKDFFRSGYVHWALICSILLNFLDWGLLAYFIKAVDFPIILHYNVYFGVDLIGDWWQVYFLPLVGVMVIGVNLALGLFFYQQKERIVTHVLLLASTIVQVIITIGVINIIRINY